MFNNRLKEKIHTLEVVVDALIGVLTRKNIMTRGEIQSQIIEQAATDIQKQAREDDE